MSTVPNNPGHSRGRREKYLCNHLTSPGIPEKYTNINGVIVFASKIVICISRTMEGMVYTQYNQAISLKDGQLHLHRQKDQAASLLFCPDAYRATSVSEMDVNNIY